MTLHAALTGIDFKLLEPKRVLDYPKCKTVCCALGHGPYAGVPAGQDVTDWDKYCLKFIPKNQLLRTWLFGYRWDTIDNTPKGAAYRIGHYLATGAIPEWFSHLAMVRYHMSDYEECLKIGREYLRVEALKSDKTYLDKLARQAKIGLE